MPSQPFHVHKQTQGSVVTLTPVGDLDRAGARRLQETVEQICRRGPTQVLLDLSHITFIDSGGLRTILRCSQIFKEHDCGFWAMSQDARIRRRLEQFGVIDELPLRR